MKVKRILINPEIGFCPPLGLLYIASFLEREGVNVEVVEFLPEKQKELLYQILSKNPDVIGITCMASQIAIVKDIISSLKELMPNAPIVLGGVHPTAMPKDVLRWGADIVVVGEGEETFFLPGKSN